MDKHGRKTGKLDRPSFHALVPDVTPLPRPNRAALERRRAEPVPAQRLLDEEAVLRDSLAGPVDGTIETGDELSYLRKGLPLSTLRKLRRAHWVIQDELDLHGLISREARPLLVEFLNGCLRRGLRCVRVIHGKGLRSKNRVPVLKHKVAHWLMQRDEILAFCQARPTEGGSGAVVVLLKAG
jgi:DNA-nicking Smr family endonuclease